METLHIDCECSSFDHSVRLVLDPDTGDLWLNMRLNTWLPWYRRLWRAIVYVVRPHGGRYGHYDEMFVNHADFDAIRQLLDKAEECRDESSGP